jgi:hypothetical protein
LLFSFSFLAGDGSRLLRRLARLFIAFDIVTLVDESIVDGNDSRCLLLLLDELRLLAKGMVHAIELLLRLLVVVLPPFACRRCCVF